MQEFTSEPQDVHLSEAPDCDNTAAEDREGSGLATRIRGPDNPAAPSCKVFAPDLPVRSSLAQKRAVRREGTRSAEDLEVSKS